VVGVSSSYTHIHHTHHKNIENKKTKKSQKKIKKKNEWNRLVASSKGCVLKKEFGRKQKLE